MRKLSCWILVILMLFSFSSCGRAEKPDKIITTFSNAMQKLDFETMSACVNEVNSDIENPFDDADEITSQLMDYLSTAAGKMTYTIDKSEVSDGKAIVTVRYKYVDASPVVLAALGEYFGQALALAFGGADEDALAQVFATIFAEKVEKVSAGTAEVSVDFECIETENGWKIKDVPDDVINVMTSNIYSAFDSFNEDSPFGDENYDADEEEYSWHNIPFGKDVELATIKIRLVDVTEEQELKSTYSSTAAKDDTKFVVITAVIENITKDPLSFNNDIYLYDDQERSYNPYEDAFMYTDNSFSYVELAPNIKETGNLIYNVPKDSQGHYLVLIKAGTNDAYRLLTD